MKIMSSGDFALVVSELESFDEGTRGNTETVITGTADLINEAVDKLAAAEDLVVFMKPEHGTAKRDSESYKLLARVLDKLQSMIDEYKLTRTLQCC